MIRSNWTWSETFGGLVVALFGLGVCLEALHYPLGHLTRMGPGFLPIVVGVMVVLLGLSIAFGKEKSVEIKPRNLRAPVFVFASLLAWALLLKPAGLVIATMALVVIAAFAHPKPNPKRVLITLVVLPVMSTIVFVYGLGLPIRPFAFL